MKKNLKTPFEVLDRRGLQQVSGGGTGNGRSLCRIPYCPVDRGPGTYCGPNCTCDVLTATCVPR